MPAKQTQKPNARLSAKEWLEKLHSSSDGLSNAEAEQRLVQYGPNLLGKKTANAWKVLARQFQSSLVYLLVVACIISYAIGDVSDGTIILVILLINTLLGFFQEYKSEKTLQKLRSFMTKQVRAMRDGQIVLIDETKIVPGDIVILREGDIAPADLSLLSEEDVQVDESQLTGESVPVAKMADGNFSANQVFAGSVIAKGELIGVVFATGRHTQLGNIAKLSTETKKQTQYEKSLRDFSSFLVKSAFLGLGLVFIFKLILEHNTSGFTGLLLFVIATAVAVVPEVLPVIATISLSSGALKLAKKHVVVKRLSSIEDLGNINLLCTDKTGTITENKMQIAEIVSEHSELFQILSYAAITPMKHRKRRAENTYDQAFLNYASPQIAAKAAEFSIIKELPFDPEARRRRIVLNNTKSKENFLVVIGAPEILLDIAECKTKAAYLKQIAEQGSNGLHHLALAYKTLTDFDPAKFDILKNENNLQFLGFVSMQDPLRPSVKNTIKTAEVLGIKLKILTGDSREVAQYVGQQVGLIKSGDKVYIGDELQVMSQSEFAAAVQACNIFARVSPTQKFEIIRALKENNVVGYQGDGINDAPALKLADVAIAVSSATDIAKENADIILLSKNLEVIVNGIRYGRAIFVNINKYIKYTMVNNFGTFVALSVLYLFSASLPMLPVQILLSNVITDIPLVTIYSDTVEDQEIVRPEKHNIRGLMLISLILGIPTALFELLYFLFVRGQALPVSQTSMYVFITFLAMIIFYAIRNKGNFWLAKMPSLILNISFIIGFILSFAIIYIRQFQIWFSFVPLSIIPVLFILILMALYFVIADQVKVWYYKTLEHN